MEGKIKYLSVKLSIMNCLGYMTAIIGPSIIDPMLRSHTIYGARVYCYSFYLAGLSPFIFFVCYFYLNRSKSCAQVYRRSMIPFAALLGPGLYFMLPEFPHMGFTMIYFSTLILSLLTYYACSNMISLYFIDDASIELSAKIEYLKAALEFWKTATITGIAAYLVFSIAWVDRVKKTVAQFVVDPRELFTLGIGVSVLVIIFSIGVIVGPLAEAMKNMKNLREAFKSIRTSSNHAIQPTDKASG